MKIFDSGISTGTGALRKDAGGNFIAQDHVGFIQQQDQFGYLRTILVEWDTAGRSGSLTIETQVADGTLWHPLVVVNSATDLSVNNTYAISSNNKFDFIRVNGVVGTPAGAFRVFIS